MSEKVDHFREKLTNFNLKRAIWVGCTLVLVLVGLGYFGISRPVIMMDTNQAGIFIKNNGGMDALIYRVDGFWYWGGGQVAMLANMPDIHQRVGPGAVPVRLQIPDIPIFDKQAAQQSRCFMRLAVRYTIPGVPIFRYTKPLYFEYARDLKIWTATNSIPARYRALGKLTTGNVGKIELSFP